MSCRVHNTQCRRTPALCSPAPRTIPVHRSDAAGTRTVGRLRVRALELSSTESQALIEATRRIKAHGKAGKPREAIKEFANLMNLGVPADTTAATTLVAACCPKMQLARSVFDELFGPQSQGGLKPDSITVAVLIRGYGALEEPDWASITTLLTEVQTTFGIEADLTVYNALLEVCARTNDVQRAEILLERMERSGCAPDDLTMEAVKHKRALRSAVKRLFDV